MSHYRSQKNKNYTSINNTIATDKRLSWKAKGIFLYAMSRPDDWVFHLNDIINQSADGRDGVRAGLKELEEYGYLIRDQRHGKNGQFEESDWLFLEEPSNLKESLPKTEKPRTVNPLTEKPLTEKPPLLSTDNTNSVVVSEKKIVDSGIEKILNVSDLHAYAVKFKPDWTYDEIQEAWTRFIKSNQLIVHPFEYIEGIINNIRILKENKDKKCKKTIVSIPTKSPQSNNYNKFYSEKDIAESPLARYARQNGLR